MSEATPPNPDHYLTMKPFNLDKALAGEPVITKDGKPVTQLTLLCCPDRQPLFGVVDNTIKRWNIDGTYLLDGEAEANDLFMEAKNVITRWCVALPERFETLYETPEAALADCPKLKPETRCRLVKFEWEE